MSGVASRQRARRGAGHGTAGANFAASGHARSGAFAAAEATPRYALLAAARRVCSAPGRPVAQRQGARLPALLSRTVALERPGPPADARTRALQQPVPGNEEASGPARGGGARYHQAAKPKCVSVVARCDSAPCGSRRRARSRACAGKGIRKAFETGDKRAEQMVEHFARAPLAFIVANVW